MAVEHTVLPVAIKWVLGVTGSLVSGGFLFFLRMINQQKVSVDEKIEKTNDKLANTYSKAEVKEQIELRIEPLHHAIERNTDAVEGLTIVLTDMRLEMAKTQGEKDGREKST